MGGHLNIFGSIPFYRHDGKTIYNNSGTPIIPRWNRPFRFIFTRPTLGTLRLQ